MKLSVGTSGYAYKEWRGSFYPEKLAASEMLRFYAERLPAVEINNTFYRLPRASVLASWKEQVPDGFRFVLKASRRITHFARLGAGAVEPTAYLLETAGALGDALGAILFQLPPNLKKDLPRLEAFLERLPEGTRAAFEFRHPSWVSDDVFEALRGHEVALVTTDSEDGGCGPIVETAPYGYLRLRRPGYPRADLARFAQQVRERDWEEAFVFFKHEDEGAGPALAAEFLEVAGRAAERKRPLPAQRPKREREAG